MAPDTKGLRIVRWILVPLAAVAGWYVALIGGIGLLTAAEAFCPPDQMVSGSCQATWWQPVEQIIFCFSTALAAVLVVGAAFLVAPSHRRQVAWIVFAGGGLVAVWMMIGTGAYWMGLTALAAGWVTARWLARSRWAGSSAAATPADPATNPAAG